MVITTQFYTTRVSNIVEQTACIRTLFLEIPYSYPRFSPGQVIQVKLAEGEYHDLPPKSYCICSLMADNVIEICFDLVNIKGVSGALYHAHPQQKISISAPFDGLSFEPPKEKIINMVGFGSGIGLIRGFMREFYQLPANWSAALHFYAINRDETSIPYQFDLALAAERYPHLEIYPVMQTHEYDIDDISDRVSSHTLYPTKSQVYIVGPRQPVRELRRHCLNMSILPENIFQVAFD